MPSCRLVNFFRSLSPLAWIPFAILWLGIGDPPAIFLIFMASFFPIVLSTTAAVANIPSVYFRVARDLGIGGHELLREVTLPAIAPQVITALRVTAGLSWLVVVAAEMIAGRDGLGFAVWDARNGLRIDLLAAAMVYRPSAWLSTGCWCCSRRPERALGYERWTRLSSPERGSSPSHLEVLTASRRRRRGSSGARGSFSCGKTTLFNLSPIPSTEA